MPCLCAVCGPGFCGPLESPGDHQVDDEKQIVLELPHQPLAEPPESKHLPAVGVIDWRIEGADQEGAGETNALEPLAGDARAERMQVELDVWQFRQLLGVDQRVPARQAGHRLAQPQGA